MDEFAKRMYEDKIKKQAERIAELEEKADAIHRYLLANNTTALMAVITELSLDAEKRAALSPKAEA